MYPNNELFLYLHQMVILMFIFRVAHQNITLVITKTVRHASNYIFRYIFMGWKKIRLEQMDHPNCCWELVRNTLHVLHDITDP